MCTCLSYNLKNIFFAGNQIEFVLVAARTCAQSITPYLTRWQSEELVMQCCSIYLAHKVSRTQAYLSVPFNVSVIED